MPLKPPPARTRKGRVQKSRLPARPLKPGIFYTATSKGIRARCLMGQVGNPWRKTSRAAPMFIGVGLELVRPKLPRPPRPDTYRGGLGTLLPETSKVWNFLRRNFQSLELFSQKLPRFGAFQRKTSKVWNFSGKNFQGRPPPERVGASLAPILIGAGLELFEAKSPKVGTFRAKVSRAARRLSAA